MSSFGQQMVQFHQHLQFPFPLPPEIRVLNPYQNQEGVNRILEDFSSKYFNDNLTRKLIVGINPGRLGAGATGIPFTDTKRLQEECNIEPPNFETHEPSSVFVYKVIQALGGPENFYRSFYINSVCPLGFIKKNKKGNWVNFNYYDQKTFFKKIKPFLISSLQQQIDFGIDTETVYSLGKKNAEFLEIINQETKLFKQIIALPHPRYIVQYKFREMDKYISVYKEHLSTHSNGISKP